MPGRLASAAVCPRQVGLTRETGRQEGDSARQNRSCRLTTADALLGLHRLHADLAAIAAMRALRRDLRGCGQTIGQCRHGGLMDQVCLVNILERHSRRERIRYFLLEGLEFYPLRPQLPDRL
jgi:hypothetical protein